MRYFFTLAPLLIAASAAMADNDYPRVLLDNGSIQVSIFLPDSRRGYYRGTRFDWSGIIERVDYDGHRFYAPLHREHDPRGHDFVSGPAGEFAMFQPMGFAEAEAGESFVKIGVGLLAKGDSKEYRFDEPYRLLRSSEWLLKYDRLSVRFAQQLRGERGWAYSYRKTIRLQPGAAGFAIEQWLENSGEKTIDIVYYNHNFTLIDDLPFGPDYRVEFAFDTEQAAAGSDLLSLRGKSLEVTAPLAGRSVWQPLFAGDDPGGYNAARVINKRSGAAVEFRGDRPIERMVFWAVERAACPEPFIRIYLEPGQSMEWVTHYRFSSGN